MPCQVWDQSVPLDLFSGEWKGPCSAINGGIIHSSLKIYPEWFLLSSFITCFLRVSENLRFVIMMLMTFWYGLGYLTSYLTFAMVIFWSYWPLPSDHQTWLAGKSLLNGGFSLGQGSINGDFFQQATFDYQKVYLIVVPLLSIDWW
jgi:hypothetical protein